MVHKKKSLFFCSMVLSVFWILMSSDTALSYDHATAVDAGFILAALERYYGTGLRDLKATYEYVDEYTDYGFTKLKEHFAVRPSLAQTEPMQRRKRHVLSWWMCDGRYRYEYNDVSKTVNGEEFVFDRVIADNGTITSLLSVRNLGERTQARGSVMQSTENHIGHPDSVRFGMGIGPIAFNKYLEDKEFTVLGSEPIDGQICYVVQVMSPYGVLHKIWLDPRKDFRSPLIECLDNEGRLLGETRTRFQQVGHTWFPADGECKYYDIGADGKRVVTRIESYHARDVEINGGIDPNVFEIQFPAGTVVYDKNLNVSYQIPGDETADDICEMLIDTVLNRAKEILYADVAHRDGDAVTHSDTLAVDPNGPVRTHPQWPSRGNENKVFTGQQYRVLPVGHLRTITVSVGICTGILVAGYFVYDGKRRRKSVA